MTTDTPRTDADYWEDEARRYCCNSQYWRERAEKAEAKVERLRSTMRSFILVSPIQFERMEKKEAEVERLKELLNRAINEIEKTPFHTPKLTAFTAHRLADRYREEMTNDSKNTPNTQEHDK